MVHRSTKVLNMYEILIESLCRNLRLVERSILSQMTKNKGKTNGDILSVSMPEPFHFMPDICGHFITRFYPKNSVESHLGNYHLLFDITVLICDLFQTLKEETCTSVLNCLKDFRVSSALMHLFLRKNCLQMGR